MPSAKAVKAARVPDSHLAFWPLVVVMLVMWVAYRLIFRGLPIWFDEVIGKAVFFGLPVWLYATMMGSKKLLQSLDVSKLKPGLLLGVALGGLYGFAAIVMLALRPGAQVLAVPYFAQPLFWGHFWLAMMTGFWETLFFYVWIMTVVQDKHRAWSMWQQIAVTVVVFTLFHIPNAFLQLPPMGAIRLLVLLVVFSAGQALLFYHRRNAYALMLSQALWGMVLLIHLS